MPDQRKPPSRLKELENLISEFERGMWTTAELFDWVFDFLPEVDVETFYRRLPEDLRHGFAEWAAGFRAEPGSPAKVGALVKWSSKPRS